MQTELKVGSEVIVDIKRIGINGEGIAFYKKLAIFVKNAIPGEGINVRITKMLDKMAFAEIVEFKHESKDRTVVACPYYDSCGACQTMHIKYEKMCEFKRDLIIESLNRYSKVNTKSFEIKKTYGMENPVGYRYKSQLQATCDKDNKFSLGLVNSDNLSVISIKNCLTHNDQINVLNDKISKILNYHKLTSYDPKTKKGDIRNVIVRVSHFNKEAQVTLVYAYSHLDAKLNEVAKDIIKLDNVVTVAKSYHDSSEDGLVLRNKAEIILGKETIVENIGKYKFELSPDAFFQLNPVQTEHLYEFALKAAKLSHKETVLDLYCGAGTIGIYMSNLAKRIIGIEFNESSVENAKRNAKLNKVRNAEYYCGTVDQILPKLLKDNINIDVVVCDPPRTGLGEKVCHTLLKHEFNRIVYVSCNHATFAKDIDILSKKYNIKYIQPVDMFPFTSSIECVAALTLKK